MKNKIALLALICMAQLKLSAQNIGINATGALPHPSAMLDVSATDKGMLVPRMTTAQRTAIAAPAAGLLVYDITTKGFWFHNTLSWVQLTSGAASNYWTLNGNHIYKNNTGNVGIGIITPLAPLHIKKDLEALRVEGTSPYIAFYNNAGTVPKVFMQNTGNNLYLGTSTGNTTGSMQVYLNNSPKMTWLPTGQVGIGTTTPADKLTVQTSGYGLTHTNGVATMGTYLGPVFRGSSYAMIGTKSNHPLHFFTNNGDAQMTLLPNGGIGMGTTSPSGKLQITHPGPSAHLILQHPVVNQYSRLLFANGGSGRYWGIAGRAGTGSVGDDRLSFYNISTGFESMVMAGNGYISIPGQLGIGTFNPAYKFSVNGTIRSKEIIVESLWADYVFDEQYKLAPL
ncbi:MAG: hypothetical protein ACXWV1_12555, partial [Chitinophagaceae bacterium]